MSEHSCSVCTDDGCLCVGRELLRGGDSLIRNITLTRNEIELVTFNTVSSDWVGSGVHGQLLFVVV